MKSKIKFGILGCGRISERHAKHISDKAELVAVCDIIEDKAIKLANEHKCNHYTSIDDFLSHSGEFDVVAVCTPNGLHAEHSIQIFNSGCHVLCEKPMALSTHDCGEMIMSAEKNNRRLFVVKQNRYNPPIKKLKELIDQDKLGKILSIQLSCFWNRNERYYSESDWKGTKKLDGGILFTQFSHFVDLLYWMIGDVKVVKGISKNFIHKDSIEFEDTGVVILEFATGAIGTINYTVNAYNKNMEGSLTVFGEKGTVKIGGQYLNEFEYQNIEGLGKIEVFSSNPPNNYGHYVGSMSNHNIIYDNLLSVLENGDSITTNFFEGLKTVEIIERIYSDSDNYRRHQ